MPYQGRQPGVGVRNRFIFIATSGQTSFSGADSNGLTLKYPDATYTDVFLNGALLIPVTDYAATNNTSVVLSSGAVTSDVVEIVAYDISSIANTVPVSGGTFSGPVTVDGKFVVNGNNYPSAGALSNRNLIINSAMQVAQRGTSFAGLTDGTLTYTLDRWAFSEQGASTGVFTVTQDTDTPAGFGSSLKVDCTTADATLAAADSFGLMQKVEAQNLQQLDYGSADARKVTYSFWVKSNKTGTYVVWLFQPDDSRSNQVQYTIDVADTWEKKTGVISADTTGIIDNNTGSGLFVRFVLASGTNYTSGTAPTAWEANTAANRYAGQTVNLADNTANYFNVTGVQLEVGDTATPFEHRSFGQELQDCTRYYEASFEAGGEASSDGKVTGTALDNSGIDAIEGTRWRVAKRAAPTITITAIAEMDGSAAGSPLVGVDHINKYGFLRFRGTGTTSGITYRYHYEADAEL